MIERVLEHWLDNSTERAFQIPFCYILQSEGYTILHVTRHCGMELGKDIIAIDPEGIPCAFQLKSASGKKISLNQWRNELNGQVTDLIYGKIAHPSIDNNYTYHKSFLVTNGEIDEEVNRAIEDFNKTLVDRKNPEQAQLKTIVRGELLKKVKDLGLSLWPTELKDINKFLEVFLLNSHNPVPKDKLTYLFDCTLELTNKSTKKISNEKKIRQITSCALLCSISIINYTNAKNYCAEIEAWILYLSYTLAYIEKYNIKEKKIENILNLVKKNIYNLFESLCMELLERKDFIEGDVKTDRPLYEIRITYLIGMLSIFYLWRRKLKISENAIDEFINKFCKEKNKFIMFWGEYATPQILAYYWFLQEVNSTQEPHFNIINLIDIITLKNNIRGNDFLPNPYFSENDTIPHYLNIAEQKLEENFRGLSYTIESLIHILIRNLFKQCIKLRWNEISKIGNCKFIQDEKWQFYLWRSQNGINIKEYYKIPKMWDELKKEAFELNENNIPEYLKKDEILLILFLIVNPHRVRTDVIRFIEYKLYGY